MEIKEQTSTKLVIESQALGLWIFVAVFLAMELYALFFGYVIPPSGAKIEWSIIPFMFFSFFFFYSWLTTLTCTLDKTTNRVVIQQKFLFNKKVTEKTLSEIEQVKLKENSRDGTPIHPVTLLLNSSEELPVYIADNILRFNWSRDQSTVANTLTQFLGLSEG